MSTTEHTNHITGIAPVGPYVALASLAGGVLVATMPWRWPKGFHQVLKWALVLTPIFVVLNWSTDALPGGLVLIFGGWWISRHHMKPEDYQLSRRKERRLIAKHLITHEYDHLRSFEAFRAYSEAQTEATIAKEQS